MEEYIFFDNRGSPLDQRVDVKIQGETLSMVFRANGGGYNSDYNIAFPLLVRRIRDSEIELVRIESAVKTDSRRIGIQWPEDYDEHGADEFAAHVRSRMFGVGSGAQGKMLLEFMLSSSLSNVDLLSILLGSSQPVSSDSIAGAWGEDHEIADGSHPGPTQLEGRLQLHLRAERQRNRALPRQKVKEALDRDGAIYCEVCDVDWQSRFGTNEPIIDCHHLKPLGSHDEEVLTTLEDLALVCPTCHRALHRMADPSDLGALRRLLSEN